mgnify:CR=1 FL=1
MLADYDLDTWIESWQSAYDQTSAAQVQPLDFRGIFNRVVVHEPSFLTGLNAFWKTSDLDDLKLWARVHVIIGSTLELPHEFDETNFEFYGKTLSGQKQQRVRWKRGVSLVNGILRRGCGPRICEEALPRVVEAAHGTAGRQPDRRLPHVHLQFCLAWRGNQAEGVGEAFQVRTEDRLHEPLA